MKFAAIALAFAAAVSAQGIADLPACSLQCLLTAVSGTGCSTTDFKCACGKADQLTASVTPCVQEACSAEDQAKVVTVLEGICSSAGVPISIPAPGASTPAPSSAAASTPAASSVAPSSAAATTPAESSPAASTPAASSPAASSPLLTDVVISSAAPYPIPSVTDASTAVLPTNGTAVTTASPSQYTGAANANGVPLAAAGLFAAIAYAL